MRPLYGGVADHAIRTVYHEEPSFAEAFCLAKEESERLTVAHILFIL